MPHGRINHGASAYRPKRQTAWLLRRAGALRNCGRYGKAAGPSILIVLVTDVLHELVARIAQPGGELQDEWLGIRPRVIDRDVAGQVSQVHARESFDDVHLRRL